MDWHWITSLISDAKAREQPLLFLGSFATSAANLANDARHVSTQAGAGLSLIRPCDEKARQDEEILARFPRCRRHTLEAGKG
jgi:hypothetical protein